jgi:uncharacterized protein YcnI
VRHALLAGAISALALPSVALAHVTVLPPYLEDGQRSTLIFTAPNERPPHSVTRLTVTLPAGIELADTPTASGWRLDLTPGKATWTGGRTGPHEIGTFRLAAKTELAPDGVVLKAEQRYDDGGFVHWTIPFTILPAAHAPKQHLWPALIAGVVGLVVIGGGLVVLRLRR